MYAAFQLQKTKANQDKFEEMLIATMEENSWMTNLNSDNFAFTSKGSSESSLSKEGA